MASHPFLQLAHVTFWPLPNNDTATIQLIQTLSSLVALGLEVELYCPRPPWRAALAPAALQTRLADHYGVPCEFIPRELPSRLPRFPALSRFLHAGLAARAVPRGRSLIMHTRDLETAWAGLHTGHQVVFESFRTWTRRSAFHRRRLLRMAARPRFLGLVTHSRYARDRYLEDGFPAEKIRAIYNGFDPNVFAVDRTPEAARRALQLPEAPTVVFIGRLAAHKGVDLLLDAAATTPELRWVLAGDPSRPDARPIVVRASALPNVQLAGYVTGERLALLLQAGDVLVIPPSSAPLHEFGHTVLPIKVFQYLAAGRPIVAGETPDTAELLVQDRNSVRIPPDDAAILASAVRALMADPGKRERLGKAALHDSAGLTWDARARAFLDFLLERTGHAA